MATIGVSATEQLYSESLARRPDVTFVDAPVSGSREPAETGKLLILASGDERAAAMLQPIFDTLGKRTLWLGPAGAGSRMKLVLNTWLAFQTEGAAESLALAEHFGVDPGLLLDALHDNPLASAYALAKANRMLEHEYRADFTLDLALKDLDLVVADAGVESVPIAADIANRWRDLVLTGASGLDVSAARRGLDTEK
jgi:3-hydroxyisobutyrate dehydrogenase